MGCRVEYGADTSQAGLCDPIRPAGIRGGAGPFVIFNIVSSNLFSAVIDLGKEQIGMLFIQTPSLQRQT